MLSPAKFISTHSPLLAISLDVDAILAAVVYALIGLILFAAFWAVVLRMSPFSIRKEIEEDQNTALGIILGAVIIGMALIISAAVRG